MTKNRRIELFNLFESKAKEQGTTVTQIAKQNGIDANLMTYWRQGRSVPKADKLIILTKAIGEPVEKFLS